MIHVNQSVKGIGHVKMIVVGSLVHAFVRTAGI